MFIFKYPVTCDIYTYLHTLTQQNAFPNFRAKHLGERIGDDLDDLLPRRDRAQHVVADRLFGDLSDEIAGNGERDVRFEQGDAHFAHRGAHVRLGQRATAAQPIENTAKPVAQAIEHTNSNPFRENTKAKTEKRTVGNESVNTLYFEGVS